MSMSTLPLNEAPSAMVSREALTSPMTRPPAWMSTRSLVVTLPVTLPATLSVEAPTLDGLLPAAKQALADAGFHRERAISFTPTGLVAYVEDEG